jgi:hypothetical protein
MAGLKCMEATWLLNHMLSKINTTILLFNHENKKKQDQQGEEPLWYCIKKKEL